jgi:hypothetical protein
MTAVVRNVPQPNQASAGNDPAVDTRIAEIIADNAGPKAHEPAHLSRKGKPEAEGKTVAEANSPTLAGGS